MGEMILLDKKLMMLAIFIAGILAISAASAEDVSGIENATYDIGVDGAEIVSADDNQAISANASDVGTFSELSGLIENASEGDILELDKDYRFAGGSNNGIEINKAITIDGKGHTLDANGQSRVFYIWTDVVLRNISFINGHNGEGGAIYSRGNCNFIGCDFANNTAQYGGAVYMIYANSSFDGCSFISNSAYDEIYYSTGGAVELYEGNCSMTRCVFENNYAKDYGDGIMKSCWHESYFKATDCIFNDDIWIPGNSSFGNCSFGDAVHLTGRSNFSNCDFNAGGCLSLGECNSNVKDCRFTNDGSNITTAVFALRSDYLIENCSFVNVSVEYEGRTLTNGPNITELHFSHAVKNCSFVNSALESDGTVDKCSFINSTASISNTQVLSSSAFGWRLLENSPDCHVRDCSFIDSDITALTVYLGDAGVWNCQRCSVVNCSFVNGRCGPVELIANCSFTNGTDNSYGAVHLMGNSQAVNCSFTDNRCRAISTSGTGLNCSIVNCRFVNNAQSGNGGAVNIYAGSCRIINSIFENNSVINDGPYEEPSGGAIYISSSNATIDNCTFTGNSIVGSGGIGANHGGAISIQETYYVDYYCSIANSNFISNAAHMGGAIYCRGVCSVDNCTFTSNSAAGHYRLYGNDWASSGGAIFFGDYNRGTHASVKNSSFTDNSAEGLGSAIYTATDLEIYDSDFSLNPAKGSPKTYGMFYDDYYCRNYADGTVTVESQYAKREVSIYDCTGLGENGDKFKTECSIESRDISITYPSEKYLSAILKDGDGHIVENADITIDLNGVVHHKVTDNNGRVKILISFAPGTYHAKITYSGDDFHRKASKDVKVTVKKATPKLTAKAKAFKRADKAKKYTVTLKTSQNKAMKNAKVTIKVNRKTYTAKTNAKGQATFKLSKLTKKGKYSATVTYNGSSYYSKVTRTVKITVK